MAARDDLLVLGAGVNGLSCALGWLAAGNRCRIWSRDDPGATTSRVAAALWYPYKVGPPEGVARWAPRAYTSFAALAAECSPSSHGVRMRETIELFPGAPETPAWREALQNFRAARPEELGPGHAAAWVYETPVIDTRLYIPFLLAQLEAHGVQVERRTCASLDEALAACPTVVNTTGLGARELCGDARLFAVRGQLVRVQQGPANANALPQRVVLDEHRDAGVRYIVPVEQGCVLGGTVEPQLEELTVDQAVLAEMRADCESLVPALRGADEAEVRVGLRPCRDEVRLELESREGGRVVHNYGHGGAGITLSWGCAAEVLHKLGLEMHTAPWRT